MRHERCDRSWEARKKQRATLAIDATRGTPLQLLAQARPGTAPARNSADWLRQRIDRFNALIARPAESDARRRSAKLKNEKLVQLGGFEPPTSGSTDRRSNHLSYSCTGLRRISFAPIPR